MLASHKQFSVIYKEAILNVSEHYINEQRVFHVTFPDNRKPLVLAVAESYGKKFWTSIPQGRHTEAEEIGRQIALFFRSSN